MKISLLGWSCEGLRCPDVNVDLRAGDDLPVHVSLLQMPNGTGKTTTLDLLKSTLSGEAVRWDEGRVRKIRRRGDDRAEGLFRVKLLIDGRTMTIELSLDFENGRASCRTTKPGSGGIQSGWLPPAALRRFLERSFLNLFVFNGELASDLFKTGQTKAEDAIDALCQLYLLRMVSDYAESEWEKKAATSAGPKTEGALASLRKRRDDLQARRTKIGRMRAKAVEKMSAAKAASDDLEQKIADRIASLEDTKKGYADAQISLVRTTGEVAVATTAVLRSIRLPLALDPAIGSSLVRLKDNLDALQLPQSTSAQFFTDLLREPECICGHTMNDAMRFQIQERAKLVLGSEEAGAMNVIKYAIENYRPNSGEPPVHESMRQQLGSLVEARRAQLEADQAVRTLRRMLIEGGDDQLKQWEDQQAEHDKGHGEAESLLLEIDGPGEESKPVDQMFSLARIDVELGGVIEKISEATSTVDLRAKTTIVKRILAQAEKGARGRIKAELLERCNERLAVILSNDPVQLAGIEGCLTLAGQEEGSVGQTLSIGYIFLMTLLERGDNRFPLIVDSPVGSMDGTLRRRVGRLIPTLCDQFVAFTINTERADFVQALESGAQDVRYLTFFRKTPGTKRLMKDLPNAGVLETRNGLLVDDKTFFDRFDIEDEE